MARDDGTFHMPLPVLVALQCDDQTVALARFTPLLEVPSGDSIGGQGQKDELSRCVVWQLKDIVIGHAAKPWQQRVAEKTFPDMGARPNDWLGGDTLLCRLEAALQRVVEACRDDLTNTERNWSWRLVGQNYQPNRMLGEGVFGQVLGENARQRVKQERGDNLPDDDD